MKALKIGTNNVREVVDFTDETAYETIRDAVNGWIECIHLPSLGVDMWVNEEGKLSNEPVQNPTATALWCDDYGPTDVTIGDVILTGGTDPRGETLGLTDAQLKALLAYDGSVFVDDLDINRYLGFTITSLD
jgi:hypothetical protein